MPGIGRGATLSRPSGECPLTRSRELNINQEPTVVDLKSSVCGLN